MKTLSIIIPVYNEPNTIGQVIDYVKSVDIGPYTKEIIVVDDGSTDGTADVVRARTDVQTILLEKNKGKGGALKEGIKKATGEYIIFQDADREYDPADFKYMLPLMESGLCDIIIGSRFKGRKQYLFGKKKNVVTFSYIGNMILKTLWNVLYQDNLTDVYPCYKLMKLADLTSVTVHADRFVYDLEMMIKLRKKGKVFVEVPIHFKARDYSQGKKIRAKDGFISIWYLIWYRFFNN